jgi:hypothetical protein
MLNVITFSVSGGLELDPGVVGDPLPLQADAAIAKPAHAPTAEIRTSTTVAKALPKDKAERAGRLQRGPKQWLLRMSSSTRRF